MAEAQPAASNFVAQLAALNARFALQLDSTLAELSRDVQDQASAVARDQLQQLYARLHKLAGSAGTFGFPALSDQARALEITAKHWLDQAQPVPVADWLVWRDALLALRPVRAQSPANASPFVRPMEPPPQPELVRVALIEDDPEQGKELALGLGQFGYQVSHYSDAAQAEAAILEQPPDALVVDIMLAGQPPADGTELVPRIFARLGRALPLVFLTARTDFPARIAAARAGGGAFLTKPASVPLLAESIEKMLRERQQIPYRVLIVDDDEVLAEHYRLTLAAAGLLAQRVAQPSQVLQAMEELRPDLLLLNLYMPQCSGAELARAIRFDPAWQSMPIVYLSAETDMEIQIQSMDSGADDFLVKPISDVQLVAQVRTRAARAREVAELMSQDSLTGLLKHASIKDRLAQELERANRHGKQVVAAMVDIDLFKQVNDRWGHPAGDQVIKTLGHLLRQRLRRQDSIGRYGGEEFLVVLPECAQADAVRLLDDIRQRFSEVAFMCQGQSYAVTLSVGLACNQAFRSASDLMAAADAALYAAKRGGRNQVQVGRVLPPPTP